MNIQNILYAAVLVILAPCSIQAGLFQTADEKAQAQLQTINTELDKGYLPIQEICKLNVHELEESNDDFLQSCIQKVSDIFDKIDTPQNTTKKSKQPQKNNNQSQSIQHNTIVSDITSWIRNTFYNDLHLSSTSTIGLDLLDETKIELDNLIGWLSSNEKLINNLDQNKHNQVDQLNKKIRSTKQRINMINRNMYSEQDIPTASTLPFWTRWKLRNRSLSRATYGVVTIPRLIGATLAAGIGYGTYHYITSQ